MGIYIFVCPLYLTEALKSLHSVQSPMLSINICQVLIDHSRCNNAYLSQIINENRNLFIDKIGFILLIQKPITLFRCWINILALLHIIQNICQVIILLQKFLLMLYSEQNLPLTFQLILSLSILQTHLTQICEVFTTECWLKF
jgi:hypothetical protein